MNNEQFSFPQKLSVTLLTNKNIINKLVSKILIFECKKLGKPEKN